MIDENGTATRDDCYKMPLQKNWTVGHQEGVRRAGFHSGFFVHLSKIELEIGDAIRLVDQDAQDS